jgi:hypothetical protein
VTEPTYEIVDNGKAILCLRCMRISHHPTDVKNRYCGFCHRFHNDPLPPPDPNQEKLF